ncbi:MAG: hypothetical protein Q8S09_04455 [Hyphomonas sp.]|nr:hypothetical protein [Hyphomonas sp.]
MPQGLQVWDASGALILDVTSRVYKILASQTINEGTNTTVSIPAVDASASIVAVDALADEEAGRPVITGVGSGTVDIGWSGGVGGTDPRQVVVMAY